MDRVTKTAKNATFAGTDNPRYLRVLHVLLQRPLLRSEVDDIAGCANGPDLIAALCNLGLKGHLTCDRIKFIDRDGKPCHPGVYHLSEVGKRLVREWKQRLKKSATLIKQRSLELFRGQ